MTQQPHLVAADPAHRRRIAVGSRLLIGGGSRLLAALGRTGPRQALHAAERLWARSTTRLLELDIDIDGLDHVDPDEQYVVVSLHEGFADALALLRLPFGLRFTVRDELFEWPDLGRYLRATRHPQVDEPADRASLRRLYREVEGVFASGDSLVVFPQGSILGIEVAFQPGAFRIAHHFQRPVLPVVLTGSHRVWEHPYAPTVRLGQRIRMQILPPTRDVATMDGLEAAMKDLALAAVDAAPRRFTPERDGWWDGYRYEIDPRVDDLARRVARHRTAGDR